MFGYNNLKLLKGFRNLMEMKENVIIFSQTDVSILRIMWLEEEYRSSQKVFYKLYKFIKKMKILSVHSNLFLNTVVIKKSLNPLIY